MKCLGISNELLLGVASGIYLNYLVRFHSALLGYHEKLLLVYLKELLNSGKSPRVPSEISLLVSSGNQ